MNQIIEEMIVITNTQTGEQMTLMEFLETHSVQEACELLGFDPDTSMGEIVHAYKMNASAIRKMHKVLKDRELEIQADVTKMSETTFERYLSYLDSFKEREDCLQARYGDSWHLLH